MPMDLNMSRGSMRFVADSGTRTCRPYYRSGVQGRQHGKSCFSWRSQPPSAPRVSIEQTAHELRRNRGGREAAAREGRPGVCHPGMVNTNVTAKEVRTCVRTGRRGSLAAEGEFREYALKAAIRWAFKSCLRGNSDSHAHEARGGHEGMISQLQPPCWRFFLRRLQHGATHKLSRQPPTWDSVACMRATAFTSLRANSAGTRRPRRAFPTRSGC